MGSGKRWTVTDSSMWLVIYVLATVCKGQPPVDGPPSKHVTDPQPNDFIQSLDGREMSMDPFNLPADLPSSQVVEPKTQGFKWSKSPSLTPKKSKILHEPSSPNVAQGTTGPDLLAKTNEFPELLGSNTAALHIKPEPMITEPPQENTQQLAFSKFLETSILNDIATNSVLSPQFVTNHLEQTPQDQTLKSVITGSIVPGKVSDPLVEIKRTEMSSVNKQPIKPADANQKHVNSVLETNTGVGNTEKKILQEPSPIHPSELSTSRSQEPQFIERSTSPRKLKVKAKSAQKFHENSILDTGLLTKSRQTNSVLQAANLLENNAVDQILQTTANQAILSKPGLNDLQSKLEILAQKFRKKASLANESSETDAFMTRQQTLSMPFQRGGRDPGNSRINPFHSLNNNVFQPLQGPTNNAVSRPSTSFNNNVFQSLQGPTNNALPTSSASRNNNGFQPPERPINNVFPQHASSRNNNGFQPPQGPINNAFPRHRTSSNNNGFQGPINNAFPQPSSSRNNNGFQPPQRPINNAFPQPSLSRNNNGFQPPRGPINNVFLQPSASLGNNGFQPPRRPINNVSPRSLNPLGNNVFQPIQRPENNAFRPSSNPIHPNNNFFQSQNQGPTDFNALEHLKSRQENTNDFRSPNRIPMNNNEFSPPRSQWVNNGNNEVFAPNFQTLNSNANSNEVLPPNSQTQNFKQIIRNDFQPQITQPNSLLQNLNTAFTNNAFQPPEPSLNKKEDNSFRQQQGFQTSGDLFQENPTLGKANEFQPPINQRKLDRGVIKPPFKPPPIHQENLGQIPDVPISPLKGFRAVHPVQRKPDPPQIQNDISFETAQRSGSEVPFRPVTLPLDEIQRIQDKFSTDQKRQSIESPRGFQNRKQIQDPPLENLQQLIFDLYMKNQHMFSKRESSVPTTSLHNTVSRQENNLHNDVTVPEANVLDQLSPNVISFLYDALKQQHGSLIKTKQKHLDTRPLSLRHRQNSLHSTELNPLLASLSTPELVKYIADATGQDFDSLMPKLAPIYYSLYMAPRKRLSEMNRLLNRNIAMQNQINLIKQLNTQTLNHPNILSVDTNSFPSVGLTFNTGMIQNHIPRHIILQ